MTLWHLIEHLEGPHYPLRDMTPKQLAKRYGVKVADYIVELRADAELWRSLFCSQRDNPEDSGEVAAQ